MALPHIEKNGCGVYIVGLTKEELLEGMQAVIKENMPEESEDEGLYPHPSERA